MSVVQNVLKMLRAGLPAFEFDEKTWRAQARRAASRHPEDEREPAKKRRKASVKDGSAKPGSAERQARSKAPRKKRRRVRSQTATGPSQSRHRKPRPKSELELLYAALGVPCGVGLEEVRSAWKKLVREHHPDLHATDPESQEVATERVKIYNNAYEQLRKRLQDEGVSGAEEGERV